MKTVGDTVLLPEGGGLSIRFAIDKNRWLIRLRWIYPIFIFVFFGFYIIVSELPNFRWTDFLVALLLPIIGNTIFNFEIKRKIKLPREAQKYQMYTSFATLQLDFDLIVLAILVFITGGFSSPIMVFFIPYVMISTFLVYPKKALRSVISAIILLTLMFYLREGFNLYSEDIPTMLGFNFILFFAYLISAYLSRNLRKNEVLIEGLLEKTKKLSVTDGLTGLYNQTHFFHLLNIETSKSKRHNFTYSLMIFDVDHFKQYNDKNGHLMGSEALQKIGRMMKAVFRTTDVLAKYGGDEFVVIMPNTHLKQAYFASERWRKIVESETFVGEETQPLGRITLSQGVAAYPDHGETGEQILDRADQALFMSKKRGRNCTVPYQPEVAEPTSSVDE